MRRLFHLMAIITLSQALSPSVQAAREKLAVDTVSSTPMASLLQVTLGLLVVLTAIVIGAWVVRRLGHFPKSAAGDLRVLGGVSMGPRERIVLLQVGKEQLLVGVAPGRIQTLHVLEEPIVYPQQPGNAASGFAARLREALGQQAGKARSQPRSAESGASLDPVREAKE